MGLVNFVKAKVVGNAVNKLVESEPRTTVLGAVLAAVQATGIDYGKLIQGDHTEEAKLVGVIATALFGYWVNHRGLK